MATSKKIAMVGLIDHEIFTKRALKITSWETISPCQLSGTNISCQLIQALCINKALELLTKFFSHSIIIINHESY